jgi:hypothetical protein
MPKDRVDSCIVIHGRSAMTLGAGQRQAPLTDTIILSDDPNHQHTKMTGPTPLPHLGFAFVERSSIPLSREGDSP